MKKTLFTYSNIYKAYLDCRQTKRKTINALKYEMNLENNLADLMRALRNHTYEPARSIRFIVTHPKPREIFAAEFNDRIAHHIVIKQVEKIWERDIFITDSYACRKYKGHHFGVERVARFTEQHTYFGQFDIANFFSKIDKVILFDLFKNVVEVQPRPAFWKDELLWLTHTIIFNDPTKNYVYKGDPGLQLQLPFGKSLLDQEPEIGMPIGNLTSQFLANVYLNELDHFVVDTLGCSAYARYVDDFLVFSNSKEDIKRWRNSIAKFVQEQLRLTLHPRKQQIQPTRHGIPFVGYFIKPWGITVRRNVVKQLKKKIHYYNSHPNVEEMAHSLNSYYGHLGKARSQNLRKHLIKEHLSLALKQEIVVHGNWHHLKVRKRSSAQKNVRQPTVTVIYDSKWFSH